jgi:hypothetical protein
LIPLQSEETEPDSTLVEGRRERLRPFSAVNTYHKCLIVIDVLLVFSVFQDVAPGFYTIPLSAYSYWTRRSQNRFLTGTFPVGSTRYHILSHRRRLSKAVQMVNDAANGTTMRCFLLSVGMRMPVNGGVLVDHCCRSRRSIQYREKEPMMKETGSQSSVVYLLVSPQRELRHQPFSVRFLPSLCSVALAKARAGGPILDTLQKHPKTGADRDSHTD